MVRFSELVATSGATKQFLASQHLPAAKQLLQVVGLCSFLTLGLGARTGVGQEESVQAYDLLPATAQAVVWIPSGEQLLERWDRTQLSKLASDPMLKPFFDDQRQVLQQRFLDAGWRLNIQPEDLADFSTGQIAVAWMEKADTPRKPYALALLVDVEDDAALNQALMDKLDQQLAPRRPTKSVSQHSGVSVTKYTMPKRAGQLLAEDSYYAITSGQLIASDDEDLVKDMISRAKREEVAGTTLAQDEVFVEARDKAEISGNAQIEYYVRPLGIARVLRAIGGKRSKSSADMLAVLQNQGFSAIQCVCGEVSLGAETADMHHHGYVLADRPLPKSAGVLDFENKVNTDVPAFVGPNVSSLMITNWNSQEAFWKTEGLVDEIAGTEGVFEEVINGFKSDPNGPRIDIRNEILPLLTNDIYSITDNRPGDVDIDSRRNLIALRVNDPVAMSKVLERAMRNEPDAELLEFEGHKVWQVTNRDDEDVTELSSDFGDFGGDAFEEEEAANQPWLSNWAIAVFDSYLMFASHSELIEEAIKQSETGEPSPLASEPDYKRIVNAIASNFGKDDPCGWQMVRNSLAYRVQYELFRAGKLQDSQSMLASILDRLLHNDSEIKSEVQRVDGGQLPDFEQVADFLQPSGLMVRATDDGWEFGGLLLTEPNVPQVAEPEESIEAASIGTARVLVSDQR